MANMKALVFLFVNRAHEAHLPESQIAEVFGKSIVHGGLSESNSESALDLLEMLAQLASAVHAPKPE
jgi:hypothetical protein